MRKSTFLTAAVLFCVLRTAVPADVNVWHGAAIPAEDTLFRRGGALVYLPDSDRFFLSMGWMYAEYSMVKGPYSEQILSARDTLWKNFLPAGKLHVWGDTTGPCDSVTWSDYFKIESHNGTVRPSLRDVYDGLAHYQYAYNSDDGKVYYYIQNNTVRYDPGTRVWEVLNPATDPAGGTGSPLYYGANGFRLRWGAMAYDPVNQEILLFGGGGVDAPKGNVGTWTYKPSTNTWTRLNLPVQPTPRALSPLVYDAKNQVIVLFSGDHLDSLLGDTWIYQCSSRSWVRKHPAVSPRPRAGHAMLYLPKSRKVVMLGGYNYHFDLSDLYQDAREYARFDSLEMWTYDVTDGAEGSWKLIKRFTSPEPASIASNAAAYAAKAAVDTADRILFISDSSFYFDRWYAAYPLGRTWIMNCDPTQIDIAGTTACGWKTDSNRTRIKRWEPAWFRQDDGSVDTGAQEALLNNLEPDTFTFIAQPRYPLGSRDYGKAAIAADRGLIFHWGGGHAASVSTNDMPEFDIHKNRWSIGYAAETALEFCHSGHGVPGTVTFTGRPLMVTHAYDRYDYCPVLRKVLLHHHLSTYLYDPDKKEWDTVAIPDHAAMGKDDQFRRALNASPHGMVSWTQTVSGYPDHYGLWILDTLTMQWKTLQIKNSEPVPPNYCEQACMVYDSQSDRMLFFRVLGWQYGNTASDGQVWEYRFRDSTLNKLNPADTAMVSTLYYVRDAVYLPKTNQVLFQDTVRVGGTKGLALYDCASNRWKCAPVKWGNGRPAGWTASANTPFLYDAKRELVFAVNADNSIWALKYQDNSLTTDGERARKLTAPETGLSVMPNPFSGRLRISVRGKDLLSNAFFQVGIYDISGKVVCRLSGKTGVFTWNTDNAPSGIYFVELRAGERTLRQKVLLAR